ncbi:MAG: hypothetical protein ABI182_03900 [Candidatus Baltobacteraceae bacterium]
MTRVRKARLHGAVLALVALSLGNCAKLQNGGVTPTPSPTPTQTPGPCSTPDTTSPNVVIVAMGSSIGAATDSTYGNIGGYAVGDAVNDIFPNQAATITKTLSGAAITLSNTLQFVNIENGTSAVNHSAAGFTTTSFPATPYTFPVALASPTNTIIGSGAWSTGRVSSAQSNLCASQEFTLKAGTYYFGDIDFYNITTFRDVLVVQSTGSSSVRDHEKKPPI